MLLIQFLIIYTISSYGTLFSQDIEIISEGEVRSFKVNIPDDTNDPLPLIILMHGLGETNSNMYGVANYFSNRNFIVFALLVIININSYQYVIQESSYTSEYNLQPCVGVDCNRWKKVGEAHYRERQQH